MALTDSAQRDPVQVHSIKDFTPGIHRYARPNVSGDYAPYGPDGSAAHAYRCWARAEVGLMPLPSYRLAQTYTETDASNPLCISLGNMMCLAPRGGGVADIVSAFLVQHGTGFGVVTEFNVTRLQVAFTTFTPTTVYNSSASQFPAGTTSWPMMDHAVFKDPSTGAYARTVVTTDPISTSLTTNPSGPGKWVSVPGWTTPTVTTRPDSANGTFTLLGGVGGSYPRVFYHESRMGIWQVGATAATPSGFVASDADVLEVTGGSGNPDLTPSTFTVTGIYFAEMGTLITTWGSWSTGEYAAIYTEGGAILLYGDFIKPNLVQKLPGVVGTNGAMGPAALSPTGMIYVRTGEGVYLWNGDNVAQNISVQLPEGVFTRTVQPGGFASAPVTNAAQHVWGEWVVFPNNWLFDTATQSWWLCEDPTVLNFQVFTDSGTGALLSSPGIATSTAGQPCTLNTYYWGRGTAASSYFWQSNPIPVSVDHLVTLVQIELVATNLSATDCTVTLQPISPAQPYAAGSFQNQNQGQSLVFTVPAGTSGYREAQRLGYTDYSISLAITAANTNTANPAPTVHGVNLSYTQPRPSGASR